jgi:parallel beta-helix repeat protein
MSLRLWLATIGLLAGTTLSASLTEAKVLVAANGSDAGTCGTSAQPCRTIGRAIAIAGVGDTVEVGPGRYGDANGDGDFADPGDEAAEIGTGCNCVIHVDKPLVVVSRDGAGATLVDGAGIPSPDLVRVDAAGTTFGKRKHGFTLRRAGGAAFRSSAERLSLAGNVALFGVGNGFAVFGDGSSVVGNRALTNDSQGFNVQFTHGVIRDNVAIGNGSHGFSPDGHNTIAGNAAMGNGDDGFHLNGGGSVLQGNVALGNGETGFNLSGGNLLTGSIASGNHRGVEVDDGDVVTKNAIVSNEGVGVVDRDGNGGQVTKNSIFGNHFATDDLIIGSNCGVLLGATVQTPPLLTQNFWGDAAGPGSDPADALCTLVPSAATTAPFATKEIKVKAKAAQ